MNEPLKGNLKDLSAMRHVPNTGCFPLHGSCICPPLSSTDCLLKRERYFTFGKIITLGKQTNVTGEIGSSRTGATIQVSLLPLVQMTNMDPNNYFFWFLFLRV